MRRLPDRRYMESSILPAISSGKPARVLFVGAERYTAHYAKWFRDSEYWTLDVRPEVEIYGAKGRHITASVIEADKHFMPGYFDVVFLNGVFGWGVDSIEDQNATLRALRSVMKDGATLVLGWNDHRVQEPLELEALKAHFSHGIGNGLPDRQSFPGSTHVYDFLRAKA
jgi:hypothetical protein